MPRDVSGNYTLPSGINPVVDGTYISVDWANPTLDDVALQLNNVVTRDGLLGPVTPFWLVDGSAAAPALAFNTDKFSGLYKAPVDGIGFSYAGVAIWTIAAVSGFTFKENVTFKKNATVEGLLSLDGSLDLNAAPGTTATVVASAGNAINTGLSFIVHGASAASQPLDILATALNQSVQIGPTGLQLAAASVPKIGTYEIGYRSVPPAAATTGTVVIGDRGKCVFATGGVTIPNNTFTQGDVLTIYNNTAAGLTITSALATALRLAGTPTTGNRTLATRGLASVLFISATEAVISGSGLT